MRKLVLSIGLAAFLFGANAQETQKVPFAIGKAPMEAQYSKEKGIIPKTLERTRQKADDSFWFRSTDFIFYLMGEENYSAMLKEYTRIAILPDSCLRIYYTNTGEEGWYGGWVGLGATIDPYSKSHSADFSTGIFTTPTKTDTITNGYTLDSVYVSGAYWRGEDSGYDQSSPDTLRFIISCYNAYTREGRNEEFSFGSRGDTTWLFPIVSVSGPDDVKGRRIMPVTEYREVVDYLLTDEDFVVLKDSADQQWFTFKNYAINTGGFMVEPGMVTNVMCHFIPGYEYELGDTLLQFKIDGEDTTSYRNNNYFELLTYKADRNIFSDPLGYNGMFVAGSGLLYQEYEVKEGYLNMNIHYQSYAQYAPSIVFKFTRGEEGVVHPYTNISEASEIVSNIYPNPASNNVTIELKSDEQAAISIFNLLGQEVKKVEVATMKTDINVADLNSGIYIIKIKQGNNVSTSKFTVR